MKAKLNKLFTLLTILTLGITNVWAAYYTPTADEVIILNTQAYDASKTDAGYSKHAAVAWAGTASTNSKKAGDPANGGAATSSNVACYSVKGNGGGKNITISITGCSKIIIYHESHSSRYVELRSGSKTGTLIGNGTASTYYTEVSLTGTTSYDIFLHGTTGSDDQDFNVYAVKLIKAASGDPVDVTGISITPSPASVKVGKTVTLAATITPNDATDKTVTWSVKSGSTYASVDASTGVVTGLAEGTAVITATANDGSGVSEDVTVNVGTCPTSGTMYKFQVATGLTDGNLTSSVPQDVVMTTENYLSFLTGGTLTGAARANVNRIKIVNGSAIGFANGADAYLEMHLDCDIEAGDIIKYTIASNNMELMAGSPTESTNKMTLDRTKTQVEVDSKLVGASALYMKRSSSSPNISYFEIYRPLYRTITLEYADGATADGSLEVIDGTAASQPTDPTWAHHRFDGWYNGASPYDWTATVSGDLTLTAHWTQLYTITYAAGDGTATGDAPTQVDKAEGETFEVAANTFAVAGKDFDTWNDGTTDYAPGDTYTMDAADVVLTAQWKAAADKYTVIFKDGETTLDTKLVEVGSNPSDAGVDKTKALSTFAAWQKDAADIALDDAFWATVVKDATVTLTARWTKAYASNADFEAYIIANNSEKDDADKAEAYVTSLNYALSTKTGTTFDANTGTNNGAYAGLKIKNDGTTLSWNVVAGKVVELKAGVMVSTGTLSINGGAAIDIEGGSTVSGDNYFINYFYSASEALYVFTTANGSAEVIKAITMRDPYTVSFNVNGGDASIADMTAMPSITLPTPTKGTDSFVGWFDALDNFWGDAGDTFTPEATIELVAHWESVSTDARLSAITLDPSTGTLAPAFNPEVVNYTYTMPYGTAAVPQITGATAVNANAQPYAIDAQATAWNETAVIRGVAQSGDSKAYNITMKMAPKDGVSIIKVETTGGTNKTVTGLYAGDGDVNLSSSKKMDNGKYIGFTLDGTTLQAGDQINVHTSTAANTGGSHIIFYDNMTDKNELYDTEEIGGLGDNIFTINAAMVGSATAYVYRSNADAAHQWNGYVDFIEVTRAINPMLTAITINGEAGVINEALKTVAVELQPGYDLAALTIVPTIVSNTDQAAVVKTVESNSGNWVIGDNTYRLTDKDGDYTEYTITLTAGALKYAVAFNTHGGNSIDGVEVVADGYLSAGQVPADPTKEDYLFQGWSLTDGGAIIADITTVQIDEPKTFHAVWAAETGVIKLIVDGATPGEKVINHTDFYTGATMATSQVTIETVDYDYAQLGGTAGTPYNQNQLNKFITYNATTTQTKVMVDVYNTTTSARQVIIKGIVEGAEEATDIATIDLDNGANKHVKSAYYSFDNTKNRTIYISVPSSVNTVDFLQVKIVETGTPLPMFGEAGYSINLNKGRLYGPSATDLPFEGMTYNLGSNYNALYSGSAVFKKSTSYQVDVPAAVTMTVTTSNASKYYVSEAADGTDNETSFEGASDFSLTAGTWYINVAGSNLNVTNIAFSAPKCAEPVIDAQPASKLDFPAGDMTASVTAHATDGGTLSYQWYNASDDSEVAGANAATLTTTTEGTYYVIVTNSLAGHADNFIKSDNATLGYIDLTDATLSALSYGGTSITLSDGVYEYDVNLAEGTVDVPLLAATATMAAYGATAVPTDAAAFVNYEATSTVLVTAADGIATQTYTVNFHVAHAIASLVDVTDDMFWDFSKADDGTAAGDNLCNNEIFANVAGINNNSNFESDNLIVTAKKFKSGKLQGSMIKFHTTVDGVIKVVFSNTGSKSSDRYLAVNGVKTESGSRNETAVTYYSFVPAGDVVLTVVEGDGNMFNFTSVKFIKKAAPDLARDAAHGDDWMKAGELGTVCVPNGAVVVGGDVYTLEGKNSSGKIVFATVDNNHMEPGVPYLFQSNGDAMYFYFTDEDAADDPDNSGAMKGTFVDLDLTDLTNVYYFAGHALWDCSDLTSLDVKANRAYVVLDENVPTVGGASPAPGRRYITMDTHGKNTTTGMDELNASEAPVKMIIDGKMFILRGEKMYNANGQLVK